MSLLRHLEQPSRAAWAAAALLVAVGVAWAPLPIVWALLVLAAGGALLVALAAQPALGVALAVILGPWQPLERAMLGWSLGSGQVMLGLALLAYTARGLALRSAPRLAWRNPLWLAFATYAGWGALSFFAAHDGTEWAGELLKWAQLLTVAALIAGEGENQRWVVLIAVLLGGLAQALFGIYQAHFRGEGPDEFLLLETPGRYRAYGGLEQPNPYGGYMGLVWPVAVALAIGIAAWAVRRQQWRWLLLSAASAAVGMACLYALVASGSRGALVGVAAAVGAMLLVLLPRSTRWVSGAALIAAAAYGLDWLNIPPALEAQLTLYGALDVRNAHITPITFSIIERLAHWQAAIRMIEAHPWFGVGLGNYAAAYPAFRLLPWENALGHAHNIYLNVFAETGAIGLVTYGLAWAAALLSAWWLARRVRMGLLEPFVALGVLGAWAHLSAHHLFDKLYVANLHLLLGAYLGWVMHGIARGSMHRASSVAPFGQLLQPDHQYHS